MAINDIKVAWDVYLTIYTAKPPADARQRSDEALGRAARSLNAAWRSDAKDASVAPWIIWLLRGQHDDDRAEGVYKEAIRRAGDLRLTYTAMLNAMVQRSSARNPQCLDFARSVSMTAPVASGAAILPVELHWYTFESIPSSAEAKKAYWLSPQVRADVIAADERCRVALVGLNGVRLRHWLAFALWRCGECARARSHFEILGSAPNEWPWGGVRRGFNWLINPYPRARRACLRA